jgi:multicomponent Na+:H+ antiporter subunit E
MLRRLASVAWITLVWVALYGDLSWANIVGGCVVAVLVLSTVRLPPIGSTRRIAAAPALRYTVLFVRDLCVATMEVSRQVFWPVDRLRPGVLAVPMRSRDRGLIALVANSITLTPGTLTLEADSERPMLWIHVLHLEEGGEDRIIKQTLALERLGAEVLRVDLAEHRLTPRRETRP